MRFRVVAIVALLALLVIAPVSAQTAPAEEAPALKLTPTESCPQAEIDRLQRVITFVQSKSWAEQPADTAFVLSPDTTACRVVLKIAEVTNAEQAALEEGGEGRLSIEETSDTAKPSRLPLVLWVIFGGAGLVLVYRRYGRR